METENIIIELKNKLLSNKEAYFRVKVHPGARINAIKGIIIDEKNGETLKIDIAAIAEKGKANNELIKFLAKEFLVKRDNIKIVSGAGDRIKLVKLSF